MNQVIGISKSLETEKIESLASSTTKFEQLEFERAKTEFGERRLRQISQQNKKSRKPNLEVNSQKLLLKLKSIIQ